MGAEDHSGTARHRPRICRRNCGCRLERQRLPPGRDCQRRRPRGLRPLPKLPGRTPAPVRPHPRCRREPPRCFRGIHRAADDQHLAALRRSDLDVAAIFDPFGNAVHTALSFPVLGEDVLITGAGPIGIMAAAVVRHAGARYVVITDVNPYRLELREGMA